ncbi:MAG: hypothetical protein RSB71_02735 [Bacilli bacterium]
MNFIKKHEVQLGISLVCFILIILALVAMYRMFYPNRDQSMNSGRLDNAVVIDNAVIEQIKTEITKTNLVDTIDYRLNVRTMKFIIKVKNDTTLEKAQALTNIMTEKLSMSITSYYDIEVYLTKELDNNFPMIGYHGKDTKVFNWVINKTGDKNEE